MATAAIKSAGEHAAEFSPKLRSIALVVATLAFVMDLLDNTIVNVAIPSIQANLGVSYSAIQWLVAGYSLTFALLLITGGRMGDVFGYKKIFLVGISGFTVASLLCGVSANAGMLVVARLLQGSMAALMVPQVMSLMQIMYKPEERGAINGLFGALGGVSASLGPIIGGLLIKANIANLDWRPIFLINVPVGIIGVLAAIKYLPDGKSPHPLKLDILGTGIIMTALFLIVFPLIQGREYDWPAWTFAMLVGSLPFLAWFVYWQRRKDRLDGSPLVLPALFRKRSFSVGLVMNMVFESAMLGFFFTFTLMLQIGLGFSAIHAALTGIPTAIAIALTMATMGEKVIPKLGRKSFLIGTTVMAVGLAVTAYTFHRYQLGLHSWQMIPGLFMVGVGMGFVFSTLFAAVLNDVDVKHAGSASGTLNAIQQVGGAVGIALIGVIFFGQLSGGAVRNFDKVQPQLQAALTAQHIPHPQQMAISEGVKNCFVDRSHEKDSTVVPASCKQVNGGSKQLSAAVQSVALKANSQNFSQAFKWATVYEVALLALCFVITFSLPKHFRASAFNEV